MVLLIFYFFFFFFISLLFFFLMIRRPPRSTLFPTRRSSDLPGSSRRGHGLRGDGLCPSAPEGVLLKGHGALRRVRYGAFGGGAFDRGEASGGHQDDKPPLRTPALLRDPYGGRDPKRGTSKACESDPFPRRERRGADPRRDPRTNPLQPRAPRHHDRGQPRGCDKGLREAAG